MSSSGHFMTHIGEIRSELLERAQLLRQACLNMPSIRKGYRLEHLLEQLEILLVTRNRKQDLGAEERREEYLRHLADIGYLARHEALLQKKWRRETREMPRMPEDDVTLQGQKAVRMQIEVGVAEKKHSKTMSKGQLTIKDRIIRQRRVELDLGCLQLARYCTDLKEASSSCWEHEHVHSCHQIERELAAGRAALLACQSIHFYTT